MMQLQAKRRPGVQSEKPSFRLILKKNGWRFSGILAAIILLSPLIGAETGNPTSTKSVKTLDVASPTQVQAQTQATLPSATPEQPAAIGGNDMNQTTEQSTSVNVNGQAMSVPDNGTVQKSVSSTDGQTQTNVTISHSSSQQSQSTSSNTSNSLNVTVQSNSNASSQGDAMP